MKLSELDAVKVLKINVYDLRSMQTDAQSFPRYDGYLLINGKKLALPHGEVDRLLSAREDELMARAERLGVELDE